MALRITLAGRVEMQAAGQPVDTNRLGSLGRLALAYLVTERARPVPRDELADVLWGEDLPKTWETSVRVVVSKLRSVLADAGLDPGQALVTQAGCYQVHLPPGSVVDVEEAGAALQRASALMAGGATADDRAGEARAAAEETAAIAARQFLPGAPGEWAERKQAELAGLRARALEVASEAAAAQGDWPAAIVAAEEAVALEPLRESAHLRLLAAHAGAGNRAEALRAYERARVLLVEELGMDPSPPLRAAYLDLLRDEPALAEPAAAPAWSGPALPAPLTSFVGRAGAIAEVRRLLGTTRLLSLTGTGGLGKTRLALRIAADEAAADPRGVALVELGPLSDPALVPQQVLAALGLGEQPGRTPLETVVDHLRARPVLLVVDNCEHVLEAAASVASTLLGACPDLRILATTREPLRVAGETVWRVPTLSVPEAGAAPAPAEVEEYEAVRLFLDRARAVRPDLSVTGDDIPALVNLVRRLDGIPLALELAAGRVGVLSVAELGERLDDRFRLLAGGSRSSPERHQTLRAAVDWTYETLPAGEATLFNRLSVFASAFTLGAAEAVCAGDGLAAADVLGLLSALVDKSMVLAEHGPVTRYRLLETMRGYGQEQLSADPAAFSARRRAHLAWAVALAAEAEPALRGPDQVQWLEVLERVLDDLRAAVAFGVAEGDGPATEALAMTAGLERFFEVRGYLSEGRRSLEVLLEVAVGDWADPQVRSKALRAAAILAQRQGDYEPARALHTESLALAEKAGEARAVAAAVHGLGNLAALQGDFATARDHFVQALSIGRELDDDNVVAAALTNLGTVSLNTGAFEEAWAYSEESLAVRRRMGDRHGIAMVTGNLAYQAFQRGDHPVARTMYGESLALQRELGDRPGIANSLVNLGYLALSEGDLAGATALLEESLALAGELGDKYGAALSLLRLAKVARAEGDFDRASSLDARALTLASAIGAKRAVAEWLEGTARTAVAQGGFRRALVLLGAAQAVRDELGAPLPPAEQPGREADLAAARTALGDAVSDGAWEEGRGLPLEDAVRLASSV